MHTTPFQRMGSCPWDSNPIPWKSRQLQLATEEQQAVDVAVQQFLEAGIIETSPSQDERYLSNFFTLQEPTKRRPILDCQKLNEFVQCAHFKMEGVPALREIIEEGDLLCKLDLKDAYTVVPIHEDSRRFLSFKHRNVVYQYRALAFGLSVAPRIFSKIMRYAIEPLRDEGIRMVYYLDDICLLAKSKHEMEMITSRVVTHLTKLFGFSIQHKNNEDHSASTQDQQSTVTDQAIEEDLGAAVMPLDCKSFGENDLNDTSCRRSAPSHSVSPEGPQPLIVGQQEQMGQPLQVEYEEQGRPPMTRRIRVGG
ncbi:hypothetical protein G6F61_012884 [Rhizopus arrhizus]|nr:hypothetical protein G6F61_012884 [Rhizopus arrhizus]